jgi:hypothetical protein
MVVSLPWLVIRALTALDTIVTAPETSQAMLGAVAGGLGRLFARWSADYRSRPDEDRKWFLLAFAAVLGVLSAMALFAPIGLSVLDRAANIETPYLKIQFASAPGERQVATDIDRNLVSFDTFDFTFFHSTTFLQFDCAERALLNKVSFETFKKNDGHRLYAQALELRAGAGSDEMATNRFSRFLFSVVNAQQADIDDAALRLRVRPVAKKLLRVVTESDDMGLHAKLIDDATKEIDRQNARFERERVRSVLPPVEWTRRAGTPWGSPQRALASPDWCSDPVVGKISDGDDDALQNLIRGQLRSKKAYLQRIVAMLFHYLNDDDTVIAVLSLKDQTDINSVSGLGDAQYLKGRGFGRAIASYEGARKTAQSTHQALANLTVVEGPDKPMHAALLTRYERAELSFRMQIAYFLAQQALDPTEDAHDGGPRLMTALSYVEEPYKKLLDGTIPYIPCIDDSWTVMVKDSWAYVTLAAMTYDLRTHKRAPDQKVVRQAQRVLEDAMGDVRTYESRVGSLNACVSPTEVTGWKRRIASHLRLANALLR